MNGPEVYATVFALGPGKKDVNILWAGSDDGVVEATRDGGKTWTNVTPRDMPDLGRVSQIDASSFDPGAAYIAVKKPLLNDPAPYIFKTHDGGKTWTKIVTGIPAHDYVHAVREDPVRRGLLYAGTQHGFYVSFDDGDHWQTLSLNLPDVQVSDIWVEASSIAIATHGRGFYVLDDIGPLRQYSDIDMTEGFHLFKPSDVTRSGGSASIAYLLQKPAQSLTIEILDSLGKTVQTIHGAAPDAGRGGRSGREGRGSAPVGRAGTVETASDDGSGGRGRGGPPTASLAAGLNRVAWNLQYPGATTFPGMVLWGATTNGPTALPGTYQARLTVDGKSQTQTFTVRKHPMHDQSDADMREQFELATQIRDKVSEANNAVIRIRKIRDAVKASLEKSSDAGLKNAGDKLSSNLSAVEEEIYQVRNRSNQDPLNFPIKINNRLASLLLTVERGDGKPIAVAPAVFKDLTEELKVQTERLAHILATDVPAYNDEAKRAGVAVIEQEK